MILFPAIDLRRGRAVRLKQGDPQQQTVVADDPVAAARRWVDEGAAWLHVVNLDGAFAEANDNGAILEQIARLGARVQFGGGLRRLEDIAGAIERGAARVVLGTVAITHPEIVARAVLRWGGERVCIALDSRDGRITTSGWRDTTDETPHDVGRQMVERGVRYALHTDVARDGGLEGVNVESTVALAQATGLRVIASGGISSCDDIRRLAATGDVYGAVVGMALYAGRLSLADALAAARGA